MLMIMMMLPLLLITLHKLCIQPKYDILANPPLIALRTRRRRVNLQRENRILHVFQSPFGDELPFIQHDQVGVFRLHLRRVTGVLISLPILHINNGHDTVQDVLPRARRQPVHLHSERSRERRPRGLDDDAIGDNVRSERFKGIGELAHKVAAYAAVEELLHAGDGLRGCQLGVDGYISEFILEEGELVRLGELGN